MLRRTSDGWRLPELGPLQAEWIASGAWNAETMHDIVRARVEEAPDRVIIVDGIARLTRKDIYESACKLGTALTRRGLVQGSAVAFQVPNWHEACVVGLACSLYGFVLVPLLPMYRERELAFILEQCRCDALFIPTVFRGTNYEELIARVAFATKREDRVFRVRGDRADVPTYEGLLREGSDLVPPPVIDNAALRLVIYTSGSTGRPKGVLHTHHTLQAFARGVVESWALDETARMYIPSPVGHVGGSIYAFEATWIGGGVGILADVWDPARAVEAIDAEAATFFAGATPFLEGLLTAAQAAGSRLPSLRRFICGGASVSPALIERAQSHMPGAIISRAYGSSEVPIACPGIASLADSHYGRFTDGRIYCDLRIVDDAGTPVADGEAGNIYARASRMFVGYLDDADEVDQFTADGFFSMGDIGRVIEGQFIEITGRKKEIIIRNGENISPREIENALMEHTAIANVVIVGIPDSRTGERAIAFVEPRPGASFSMDEMRAFLTLAGISKPKFPEEIHIRERLPINSIGKVLKGQLREELLASRA